MPQRKIGEAILEMVRTAFERPVTKEYPFGPAKVAERFRGKLEVDPVKCTGCKICEIVCPASAVEMVVVGKRKVGDREIEIQRPVFNLYTCISCGQCVDDCRFGALRLSRRFELATKDKSTLMMREAAESVQ